MEAESRDILFKALDCLTDLLRCSDGTKEQYKAACNMLKNEKLPIAELYKMEIPIKQKIKFTTFSLFGTTIHSHINALLHKKLC